MAFARDARGKPLHTSYSIERYIRNTTTEGFLQDISPSGRARLGAAGCLVPLIRIKPQAQSIPRARQHTGMVI